MSRQFDSITFNEKKDKAVVTCECGSPEHGVLIFNVTRYPVTKDWHMNIEFDLSFSAVPYAYKLAHRIRNAVDAFRSRPVDVDLSVIQDDIRKLGQWLLDSTDPPKRDNPEWKLQ